MRIRVVTEMKDLRKVGRPLSRRTFIRAAGAAGAGFVLYAYLPGGTKQAVAAIPGGTLDPLSVPKFATPLLIPPVMPRAATIRLPGGKPSAGFCERVRLLLESEPKVRPAPHSAVSPGGPTPHRP